MEKLSRESRAGQCAHQESESANGRRSPRLRRREDEELRSRGGRRCEDARPAHDDGCALARDARVPSRGGTFQAESRLRDSVDARHREQRQGSALNEMEPPIVALRGVTKRFPNGTQALAPIDLDVRDGEFVTLLGPSGCGKTTLLNLIAGLTTPSSGTIGWWGGSLAAAGVAGRKFGFVFQAPTLMPWARVDANVRLPLDLAHVDRTRAEQAVAHAL